MESLRSSCLKLFRSRSHFGAVIWSHSEAVVTPEQVFGVIPEEVLGITLEQLLLPEHVFGVTPEQVFGVTPKLESLRSLESGVTLWSPESLLALNAENQSGVTSFFCILQAVSCSRNIPVINVEQRLYGSIILQDTTMVAVNMDNSVMVSRRVSQPATDRLQQKLHI